MNLLNAPSSGISWTDVSGYGNNGTIIKTGTGSATYTSAHNGGLILGPSQITNMAMIATTYNLVVPFTVEVIVNLNPSAYWSSLWGNESYTASKGYLAYWSGSSLLSIGGSAAANSYSISANTGNIRQIIVTVDATPSLKLYINGSLQTASQTLYANPGSTSTGLNFGSRHPNAGTSSTPMDACVGTYYQMRVYNIALNQTQVTANYNAVKSTYGI